MARSALFQPPSPSLEALIERTPSAHTRALAHTARWRSCGVPSLTPRAAAGPAAASCAQRPAAWLRRDVARALCIACCALLGLRLPEGCNGDSAAPRCRDAVSHPQRARHGSASNKRRIPHLVRARWRHVHSPFWPPLLQARLQSRETPMGCLCATGAPSSYRCHVPNQEPGPQSANRSGRVGAATAGLARRGDADGSGANSVRQQQHDPPPGHL
jgi:hypothetical protein